jgi:hypothetical protein
MHGRKIGSLRNHWCERGDSNPHGFTRQILSLCVKLGNANIYAVVMHVTDRVHTVLHTMPHHANQTRWHLADSLNV